MPEETKPRVVHCKREAFDVYISRPGPFGNPFKLGPDGNREQVIALYREWLHKPQQFNFVQKIKRELRGKVLGCWCAPKACHGDVLMEVANDD
jgi:hypothetical protein